MKWTREKPVKSGFYWLRRSALPDVVVEVSETEWITFAMMYGEAVPVGSVDGLWAGPLTTDDIQEE